MGILSGGLTVRRYRVDGEPPEGFRDTYVEALNKNAFREPLSPVHKEEVLGWCQIHNLLDVEFDDINLWIYNHYLLFALRLDKKTLPAKYFQAHLKKRMAAWCKETGREKCPAKVKEELKAALEEEMLRKTLPKAATQEVVWNVAEGWVAFHNQSDAMNDKFRKLFFRTFGIRLLPWIPLDFVADNADLVARLGAIGTSEVREDGRNGS